MSRAEELAKKLETGDRSGMWYPGLSAAAELRRLSAVEAELIALKKAIGDAEPVAWANFAENRNVRIWSQKPEESSWSGLPLTPLYTLKGIKNAK